MTVIETRKSRRRPKASVVALTGLGVSIANGYLLSWMVYLAQVAYNPRPLEHEFWWGIHDLLTVLAGAFFGVLGNLVFWYGKTALKWLVPGILACNLGLTYILYYPGNPSDPKDPSFTLD